MKRAVAALVGLALGILAAVQGFLAYEALAAAAPLGAAGAGFGAVASSLVACALGRYAVVGSASSSVVVRVLFHLLWFADFLPTVFSALYYLWVHDALRNRIVDGAILIQATGIATFVTFMLNPVTIPVAAAWLVILFLGSRQFVLVANLSVLPVLIVAVVIWFEQPTGTDLAGGALLALVAGLTTAGVYDLGDLHALRFRLSDRLSNGA